MFAIVLEMPIKLQNGLRDSRVEVEERTHSGTRLPNRSSFSGIHPNMLDRYSCSSDVCPCMEPGNDVYPSKSLYHRLTAIQTEGQT